MNNASLELGGTNWAEKDGSLLGYTVSDDSGRFFPQEFTFTRGSNLAATRIGKTGLIEKGRENLVLQSNQFDTTWGTTRSSVTGGQSGYDGSNDAWKLIGTTPADGVKDHYLRQSFSATGVLTVSGYFKAAEKNTIRILFNNSDPTPRVDFDLANGSVHNKSNVIAASIVSVGNGWYRCSVTGILTVSALIQIYATESLNATSWVGDDTSGVYIQDAQLEQGLAASPYIETTTTTAQAGVLENTPRLNYTTGVANPYLLLEPSRTNLVTESEYYNGSYWGRTSVSVADNAATSPEGLQNASKLIPDNGTGGNRSISKNYLSLTGLHTFSVFAKAGEYGYISLRLRNSPSARAVFDLTNGLVHSANTTQQMVSGSPKIEDYGNGWYRCSIVIDPSGSASAGQVYPSYSAGITGNETNAFSGDGVSGIYIWGSQFEAGSYPTSYIPTYGVSQTRNFDYSTIESLGYSSTCTFYYEFNTTTGRDTSSPFAEIGKDQSNKIWIKGASADSPQFSVQGNGIFSGSISVTNEVSGINKIAVQWSSGVGVVFSNGVKQSGTLTNSNTSESIDFISIKGQGTSHDSKQLLFFPTVLSDAELVTLTTI